MSGSAQQDQPAPVDGAGESCATCMFSHSVGIPNAESVMLCRRYPPVMMFALVPRPAPPGRIAQANAQQVTVGFHAEPIYPTVNPAAWCGEFDDGESFEDERLDS